MVNLLKYFLFAFWLLSWNCAAQTANENSAAPYEYPPPLPGSVPWLEAQKAAQALQELYRKRIALPGALDTNLPRAPLANFANPQFANPVKLSAPNASVDALKIFLALTALLGGALLLMLTLGRKRLQEFNQQWNPWATTLSETLPEINAPVRSEDAAFADFIKNFHERRSVNRSAISPLDVAAEFHSRIPAILATQRKCLTSIEAGAKGLLRQQLLLKLREEMSVLQTLADFPAALAVGQLASALAGLLQQLTDKMGNVTPSSLRAVRSGVELLESMCLPELKPDLLTEPPRRFLVVDDDLISRHALSLALKKAFSTPDLVADGSAALVLLNQHAYDVVFLDVLMPEMDGFELCLQLRTTALNCATPVVFVTNLSDFEARTPATLSGGNELMAKPFLTFEITVRALTLALQGRLQTQINKSTAPESSLVTSAQGQSKPLFQPGANHQLQAKATPASLKYSDQANIFLARARTHLHSLRELSALLRKTSDVAIRQSQLAASFLPISSLAPETDAEMVHPAFQLRAALEGLVRKLLESPENSTSSALATFAAAVELLSEFSAGDPLVATADDSPFRLLVVDDDLLARRVITSALQTVFEKPDSVDSGAAALALAENKMFDAIFLDVVMPEMDGFETCLRLRQTALNQATPIVFVTAQTKVPNVGATAC